MIKLIDILKEAIKASEAYNDLNSIKTLVDNKRGVAFVVRSSSYPDKWKEIQRLIKDNDLQTIFVKGNPGDAYVVYRKGFEKDAIELKDIAEKYGGYLSYEATEEESRRIGELLGYAKEDIDEYIRKNYKK